MKRNIIAKVKKNAKKLKDSATRLGFPNGTRLFIRDNLSPNMKTLAYNARLLKQEEIIEDTWFWNAAVRMKVGDKYYKVTHETDLHKMFHDFENFSFDTDFCSRVLFENPEFLEMREMDDLAGAWSEGFGPDAAAVRERMRQITE